MELTEIIGAAAGFLFVILEIKQKRVMWIVGGVSALFYIALFFDASLYAAAALQFYYLWASFYGWFVWKKQSKSEGDDQPMVVDMPVKKVIISSVLALAGFFVVWYLLATYSSDPMPVTDASIAAISMLATYWVANRNIYHWLLWIVADVIAVYMYLNQELYATTVLYLIYTIAAVIGFIHWRKFKRVLN